MNAGDIIAKVRHGAELSPSEIGWFANGLASGQVTDAQAGAFAMAVCLTGLGRAGRVALTEAMRDTGERIDWGLPGPVVDKHSTGGVGDAVSLVLAPALAACGCFVPMISGRGLGHTGGTLDKLEAIPGLSTQLDEAHFRAAVEAVGCAIVGATADIAPADRRLYGIRDVTATVDSVDLITASILSKKLAVALDALVLDVKHGSGAIFSDLTQAKALARALVQTAQGAGVECCALLTDMSQPLIPALGNAVELVEVMEVLINPQPQTPLHQITCALGGEVLALAGQAVTPVAGAKLVAEALSSGRAADRFARMIVAMGGPSDFLKNHADRLPAAAVTAVVLTDRQGWVSAIDGQALGWTVVDLGGGRRTGTDRINPGVGISQLVRIGEEVDAEAPLALVHAATPSAAEAAAQRVIDAITISDTPPPEAPPLILDRLA